MATRTSRRQPGMDDDEVDLASEAADTAQEGGGATDAIRGKLPPGATREDYLGGDKPHKTRAKGGTPRAGARKNEVV